MKASAALLAGLLAGLALGGASYAQPPPGPTVIAQNESEDDENPMKGLSPKAARCAMSCQEPTFQCARRCGRESASPACMDTCQKKHNDCMQQCGVNPKKLG